jgi:hypothetical protein
VVGVLQSKILFILTELLFNATGLLYCLYQVVKQYEDFEKFHRDLNNEFPRTVLPQMPKVFLTSLFELNISERRSAVEELLKFVAVTPIVATNHVTLEFLGKLSSAVFLF